MLMENLSVLLNAVSAYTEKNPLWILYVVCIIILLIIRKRDARQLFIFPLAVQLLTVFNPLLLGFLVSVMGFENRYLRLLWIVPFFITIAYTAVVIIFSVRKKALRFGLSLAIAALICLFGIPVFWGKEVPPYVKAENTAFTQDEVLELSRIYHQEGEACPLVLHDFWLTLNYRMYDPAIKSYLGRNSFMYLNQTSTDAFKKKENVSKARRRLLLVYYYEDLSVSKENFIRAAQKLGIQYITASASSPLNDYFREAGMIYKGSTSSYCVWGLERR